MKTYHTINQLFLESNKVYCKRKSGKGKQELPQRQGTLDGACGAYSLAMALMIIGLLNDEDVVTNSHDKRTSLGKFIRQLVSENGLYVDGSFLLDYKKIVDSNFSKLVISELFIEKNEVAIDFIVKKIVENVPVILDVQFSGGAHALLVVGVSFDDNQQVEKLLCLDPGFESPTCCTWNSLIDIKHIYSKKKFCYYWETNDMMIYINEALVIEKK